MPNPQAATSHSWAREQPTAAHLDITKIMHDIGNALGRINFQCAQLSEAITQGKQLAQHDIAIMSAECSLCIELLHQAAENGGGALVQNADLRCEADAVVAFVIDSHQHLLSDNIEIDFAIPDNMSFTCAMSHNALYRCLSNLLINACHAIPERGKIRIELGATRLAHHGVCASCAGDFQGSYIYCTVGDSGNGIAPEHLPHIFTPYVTSKNEGSGVGLPIVHELVHQCAGHIQVESEIGSGAQFTLYIPSVKTR